MRQVGCYEDRGALKGRRGKGDVSDFSVENLLERGYQEFPVSRVEHADRFFQRRVRDVADASRTLYFVNVYYYAHADNVVGWATKTQFRLDGGTCVDLEVHQTSTIDESEEVVKRAFAGLNAVAYSD